MDYQSLAQLWTLVEVWRKVEHGISSRLIDRIKDAKDDAAAQGKEAVTVALSPDAFAKIVGESDLDPAAQWQALRMSRVGAYDLWGMAVILIDGLPDDFWVLGFEESDQ